MNIIQPNYPAPDKPISSSNLTGVETLVIHHSAGPTTQTPLQIDSYERGEYSMIPYEYLIDIKGNVYAGRPLQFESAATYAENPTTVAVCCIGNFQSDDAGYTGAPSREMLQALCDLSVYLHQRIPSIQETVGHRDVGKRHAYSTACPGDTLEALIPVVRHNTALALEKRSKEDEPHGQEEAHS